ncbi:LTA synthase family protein [Daejeonella oryzae]|uniref:LTA synthase family protein n=1 Tax=Daejeonella oryzae TaxID=1122943 RepID=UPI0003FDCED1|nr:alkaline phosphatase family protein [Daejeonella oryzae]
MENTYFEDPEYPFLDKIQKCMGLFINLSLAFLLALLLIRSFELIYLIQSNNVPADLNKIIWEAVLFDILFFFKILPFLFIPFLIVFFGSNIKKASYWTFGVIGSIFILIYLLLIKYFSVALVPLGADLFGYSMNDIKQTVAGSPSMDTFSIVGILAVLIIFWLVLSFVNRKSFVKPKVAMVVLVLAILLVYNGLSALPPSTSFKSEFSYNLAVNKAAFFTEKTTGYFINSEPEIDIYAINYLEDDDATGFKRFNYTDSNYPFLRTEDSEDVLGNFLNIDYASKPNIVFIQVEGLGRAFSGPNSYLGSFTPFLDELSEKSLYWENFVASQGRTFASLPSILGSLPFAEKGFSDLGAKMPKFLSLQNILAKNGYHNNFYGGFEMEFDNQGQFMKNAGTDKIVGLKDFGSGYQRSPNGASGMNWGFADRDLMKKSLQMESMRRQQPYLTYIETISMHTPYTIPNQQQFLSIFEKRMQSLGFDEAKKMNYRQYQNIYSSIMYTDDALRYFFDEYAKLPAYKNTIFIITGDHRLPEIPMSTKIDRYHVPLIVYSPMLKRTAKIRSISSHMDITPSLLALAKHSYKLNTPSSVTWIGSGLDTSRNLRNIHNYPLKQTKSDLHNFISGLFFIDQDILFSIGDNMSLVPLNDEAKLNQVRSEFNQYKARNDRFKKEFKIMPDQLYSQFK